MFLLGTTRPTHYHVLCDEIGFSADDLQELQNPNASVVSPTEEILSSWGKHELGVSKSELMSTYIIENFDSSDENISWAFTRKENNAERARYLHCRDNMYDLGYCAKNHCAKFETATAMAFISCIRLILSGLQNQWDLSNLTNQGHGILQYDQAYFPRMGNLTAVSDVPTLQRNGFLPRSSSVAQKMLQYEPSKRISAKKAMEHPYFDDLDKTYL